MSLIFYPEEVTPDSSPAIDPADVSAPVFRGLAHEMYAAPARAAVGVGRALSLAAGAVNVPIDAMFGTRLQEDAFAAVDVLGGYREKLTLGRDEIGVASRIIGGAGEFMTTLAASGFNPAPAIAAQELNTAADLAGQGVDPMLAVGAGVTEAAGTALAFHIPGMGATALQRIALGVTGNVGVGVGGRGAVAALLGAGGAPDAARQFSAWNGEALAADALMGAVFGGVQHFTAPDAPATRVPTEVADAVTSVADHAHRVVGTAPGRPLDGMALEEHARALDDAVVAMMRDEPVTAQVREGAFEQDPRAEGIAAERQAAADEELAAPWADADALDVFAPKPAPVVAAAPPAAVAATGGGDAMPAARPVGPVPSPYTLKVSDAETEGLSGWRPRPGQKGVVYSIVEGDKPIGFLDVSISPDGAARIEDIVANAGRGRIGLAGVRSLLRALRENHPEITSINGERVSGIRRGGQHGSAGSGVEVSIPLRAQFPDVKPKVIKEARTRAEAAAARHAAEARIDPVRDDLLAAIAKEGGISREAAQAAGIDPAEFNRRGWRIAKVFTGKGLSLEAMAERLAARGYPVTDANGYGENPMLDALDRSLRGETVKAPDGMEADIAAAAAERDAMQAHEAPLLADHEYAGLDSPNQQRLLDAAVRAQDAGVPLDDIQTITELGGANGYDTAEIIRLLDEETGQRGRATRGGAAASEGAAVDTGGGRADAGPSAESADGQPVKSIEAAPTFAGLDDLIAKYPDLTLTDEAGNEISARDMMAAAAEEVKAARELKPGIDALVACTLQYIGEAV